jgi:hypothetical protein
MRPNGQALHAQRTAAPGQRTEAHRQQRGYHLLTQQSGQLTAQIDP